MTDALILGGVRTPVGQYGGSLSRLRTDDLLGQTMVAACERVGVPLELAMQGSIAQATVLHGDGQEVAQEWFPIGIAPAPRGPDGRIG